MEDQKPQARVKSTETAVPIERDRVVVGARTTPERIQRKREERASHTMRMASTWTMQY